MVFLFLRQLRGLLSGIWGKGMKRVYFFCFLVMVPVLFLSTYPFAFEHVLIWDDWVWINNSSIEHFNVPVQLGFWWLGKLNQFLYDTGSANTILFLIAFISHVLTAFVGLSFIKKINILPRYCEFCWFFIYLVFPCMSISYTNSVAFYNLYVLLFYAGSYLLFFGERTVSFILSLFFLFFSFSLASLVFGYASLLILYVCYVDNKNKSLYSFFCYFKPNYLFDSVRSAYNKIKYKIFILFILPFLFYAFKKIWPLFYVIEKKSNPYGYYNLPDFEALYKVPYHLILSLFKLIAEMLYYPYFDFNSVSLIAVIALFLFSFSLSRPRVSGFSEVGINYGNNKFVLLSSIIVVIVSILFPYSLVGKYPTLSDMQEARHLIPTFPLFLVVALFFIDYFLSFLPKIGICKKYSALIVSFVICSTSAASAVSASGRIWFDEMARRDLVSAIKDSGLESQLWIFNDSRSRAVNRKIWNYEYTGYLIDAFGGRDHLGVSTAEYVTWKVPILLLSDDWFKRRYNIEDFDGIGDSYVEIMAQNLKPLTDSYIELSFFSSLLSKRGMKFRNLYHYVMQKEHICVPSFYDAANNDTFKEIVLKNFALKSVRDSSSDDISEDMYDFGICGSALLNNIINGNVNLKMSDNGKIVYSIPLSGYDLVYAAQNCTSSLDVENNRLIIEGR